MFREFFDWFCNSLKEVFITMDKFILFDNFSYFDFAVGLLATGIIFRILKLIMLIEDEEPNIQPTISTIKPQYDSNEWNKYNNKPIYWSNYKGKHTANYRVEYIPKHEYADRGKHGVFRGRSVRK